MGGLTNTVKRFGNASIGRGYKTNTERREEKKANKQNALDKIYAGAEMPDEEVIKRNERRKAAKRRGSRVNTILTDDNQETMG